MFQGQILKFLLYFYSLFIWLCSDFVSIHLNTENNRSDKVFQMCEPRQELLYTDLFSCSMNIKLHSPLHFPWLWDTEVDCFMSKISLLPFTDPARNGSALTHHSLVICTPFGSHQLFGNCLHLVLAWGVGGERKNLLSTFPTHICVGPVNSVFGSLFKG